MCVYDFGTNRSNIPPTFLAVHIQMYVFSQKRLIRKGLLHDLLDVRQIAYAVSA
jgi:hypothetical protein